MSNSIYDDSVTYAIKGILQDLLNLQSNVDPYPTLLGFGGHPQRNYEFWAACYHQIPWLVKHVQTLINEYFRGEMKLQIIDHYIAIIDDQDQVIKQAKEMVAIFDAAEPDLFTTDENGVQRVSVGWTIDLYEQIRRLDLQKIRDA